MTIIAVQCRLASTRLPQKALLDLSGKKLLEWTLSSLKKVHADQYWIATDEESFPILSEIAKNHDWDCFFGPKDDVLERYCLLAEKTGATTILRATADNPFLFYETAQESLVEFEKRDCDYFGFTGLPHGSGIEVFSAQAILKARTLTQDSYDHEHVGPSLYNHPEWFKTEYQEAPFKWTHKTEKNEEFRTTIDTPTDYRTALRIIAFLDSKNAQKPYSAEDIFAALEADFVTKPLLIVPTVKEGRGTGHIRRCVKIAESFANSGIFAELLLLEEASAECKKILEAAKNIASVNEMPQIGEYSAIITDCFELSEPLAMALRSIAPLISLDDGSDFKNYIDYSVNIILPLKENDNANACVPQFLDLPKPQKNNSTQKKVLVSIGGEDPANFSDVLFENLSKIASKYEYEVHSTKNQPIENLKDSLYLYDIVFTHFGMTAFEALSAGCTVVTVATSKIHKKLSKYYKLLCLDKKDCNEKKLAKILSGSYKIEVPKFADSFDWNGVTEGEGQKLENYLLKIALGTRCLCPVCKKENIHDKIIARDYNKTIKHCSICNINYISYVIADEMDYDENYFFDAYKNQYGKTYLEDFESIKNQGFRRLKNIQSVISANGEKTLLDIGCAYGPFLSAAKDSGFIPFGADVAEGAVKYVTETLGFDAICCDFYKFDTTKQFDVVTMWYVIEHFQDLDSVLTIVSKLVHDGGIFAFSTPNGLGISRKRNLKQFFSQGPNDHFSIWDYKCAKTILTKYGFNVKKIVTTGIHKNRFPFWMRKLPQPIFLFIANLFKLGDTFEVYCEKGQTL